MSKITNDGLTGCFIAVRNSGRQRVKVGLLFLKKIIPLISDEYRSSLQNSNDSSVMTSGTEGILTSMEPWYIAQLAMLLANGSALSIAE